MKAGMAAAVAAVAFGAWADFEINLDPEAQPIRDARKTTCGPLIGYAGCRTGVNISDDDKVFGEYREATSAICRESGAWFQRMWTANRWFDHRKPNPYDPNSKDKEEQKRYRKYVQSKPDLAFSFWKDNGIKVLFTLEAPWPSDCTNIIEFVDYIVSNKYESVVAGFELGNETYFAKREWMPGLCANWNRLIPEIKRRMPKVELGIPVCEYFENNPDLAQIRARCTDKELLKCEGYFSACSGNQTSAEMILCLSNSMKYVSHVIYHAYGAETPYSCSYYGFQRFRNFAAGFPEIQGKRFWLSEIRPRSDEDERCQRIFRESLISSHYALMAICQPDLDGYNHHEFSSLSGAFHLSNGSSWVVQWRDAGGSYPDRRAPEGKMRYEVGSQGVAYRILTEAILDHPLFIAHGTSKAMNEEDTFFTSARVTDQVYARRRARKEGKRGADLPKVEGEVEYVAALNRGRNELCLLMVNSKSEEVGVKVTLKGRQFAAPTYIALSCPEEHVDDSAVPGEGHWWRQVGWEDTQSGYFVVPMAMYKGLQPKCDVLNVTIAPHTVQSVTVRVRPVPKAK